MGANKMSAKSQVLGFASHIFSPFALLTVFLTAVVIGESNAQAINLGSVGNAKTGERCKERSGLVGLIQKVNIFSQDGQDPRVIQSRTGNDKAFAPIGVIEPTKPVPSLNSVDSRGNPTLVKTSATAFLVSPCHILTNFHAVFGKTDHGSPDAKATFFMANGKEGTYKNVLATPVVWGNPYTKKVDGSFAMEAGKDWALLKLATCEGKQIGWMETLATTREELINKTVSMAGFPGDKSVDSLWTHADCKIRQVRVAQDPNILYHSCSSASGSSGSPVFEMDSNYPRVLALFAGDNNHTGEVSRYSPEHANYAIDMSSILPQIRKYIDADKQLAGLRTNPALTTSVATRN